MPFSPNWGASEKPELALSLGLSTKGGRAGPLARISSPSFGFSLYAGRSSTGADANNNCIKAEAVSGSPRAGTADPSAVDRSTDFSLVGTATASGGSFANVSTDLSLARAGTASGGSFWSNPATKSSGETGGAFWL